MENTIKLTKSLKETQAFGAEFAREINRGMVIFLEGDLAAGKTAFTKGLAEGLGVKANVNSPTFTILKEYQGNEFELKHIDAYRLEGSTDDSLGFYDLIDEDTVVVIEWPEYIKHLDIRCDYHLKFKVISDFEREIEVIKC